jgi:magnesium transporter
MTTVRTRVWCKGALEAENFPVSDVAGYVGRPDTVVWVDFLAPSSKELDELAGALGLHDLAIEDALEPHQRPKVDHYASHLFITCHAIRLDLDAGRLDKTEIDTFVGDRWMITVRSDDNAPFDQVLARWDQSTDLAEHGVSYLLYGLLDVVVDGYFDAVEAFDEYYDKVSEGIFADRPLAPSEQQHWFEMRRALVHFHRLVVPMREVVSGLMRREHSLVAEDLYPYYQDVYDHILRVSESSESLRDLVSTIVETNLSLRDFRQNQVMKKVSSWAAIVAVPTLITGYYGMNVPYPGFADRWGAAVATAMMLVMSGGLYATFRRNDWL